MSDEPSRLIEHAVAARPLPGETMSGDLAVVRPFGANGDKRFQVGVLVAAIDALGHGDEAEAAAHQASVTLKQFAHESPISLIKRCHESLNRMRGAVVSLASFNARDSTMTWLGVGNVEGLLVHLDGETKPARESLMLRGGVVGYQLPSLRATVIPVLPGDMLVFATDGIRGGFTEGLSLKDPPQQIADFILDRYGKATDDALVLVVRYLGGGP